MMSQVSKSTLRSVVTSFYDGFLQTFAKEKPTATPSASGTLPWPVATLLQRVALGWQLLTQILR